MDGRHGLVDPQRWRRIETLFHTAREWPAGERTGRLDSACDGDDDLRLEIEGLLAQDDRSRLLLDRAASSALEPRAGSTFADARHLAGRATPLVPGTHLGRYEILSPLGAGGMGHVYKARDTRLDRIVAVKVSNKQFSDRFEREARAVARLNHANICTLYDVEQNYLVMEYIEGTCLTGPMPPEQAVHYAVQICDALDAAHKKGITHRDLKPANILVAATGVKLLDFGIARVEPVPRSSEDAIQDQALTDGGTILGTAAYMSPEQAEGKPVDARSDIFSFGVVLYEMLSGARAFNGDSAMAIMAAILHKDPAPLAAPPALRNVVVRCLAKSAADRFQSATELRAALEAAAIAKAEPPQRSIVVLPFANTGGDKENEYFSDGLTEEIINTLAQIAGLRVIARTSAFAFRGKEQDIRKIAGALNVSTVLEGSVRRAGNRIRVTAQLIDAADGSHLWSERYDREMADIFTVQDEIATAIAAALKMKLAGQLVSAPRHTPNVAAYHEVLRARFYLSKLTPETIGRARECLACAIAIDPDYALPHSVLGGSFVTPAVFGMLPAHEAMPLARAAHKRALEIDPTLPEALAGLASVAILYDYDFKEAGRLFELARTRGPLPGGARARYGHYLLFIGQAEAALKEQLSAVQEDPLNSMLRSILAFVLMVVGRPSDAASECGHILELNEHFHPGHFYLSLSYLERGDIRAALAPAERAYALAPWVRANSGYIAGLLTLTGDTRRAEAVLKTLGDGTDYGAPFGFVYYHLVRSNIEQAADWAEQAIDQRDPTVRFLPLHPLAKDLRRSSRWPALAKMMNLPELH